MSKRNGKNKAAPAVKSSDGFEMLGGGLGKEMALGEVVTGVYGGVARVMPGKRKGTTVPFYQVGDRVLLGSTVLRTRIEEGEKAGKLKVGDTIRVTRIEDLPAKRGQAPAKMHTVEVKRN
jgi:hypothetical protein